MSSYGHDGCGALSIQKSHQPINVRENQPIKVADPTQSCVFHEHSARDFTETYRPNCSRQCVLDN